jgi:hypothetical protein
MKFPTPHRADDVFPKFFGMLLKMMKYCNVAKQYIPAPNQFWFMLVTFSRHEPVNLALVNDQFGTCFGKIRATCSPVCNV